MCAERTCDLLDGAREPLAAAHSPKPEGISEDDADGDRGVIERLRIDRIDLRETKYDRDECDPEYGGNRDRVRELAEVERPSHESVSVHHAQGDGESYDRLFQWRKEGKGK